MRIEFVSHKFTKSFTTEPHSCQESLKQNLDLGKEKEKENSIAKGFNGFYFILIGTANLAGQIITIRLILH